MTQYNIELLGFIPPPESTLVKYFNTRLNELADNPKVDEIKTAKLIASTQKLIPSSLDYLLSQQVVNYYIYHTCQVIVVISGVECNIADYSDSYFENAIDKVINEALSRSFRYG